MRSNILALALVSSALLLAPAFAQQPAPAATQAQHSGDWRASKLIGVNVYNDQNEKLGEINEILVDRSGKVDGVIVGVGGFLGMGERNIKLDMSKLKFVNEPMKSASTTGATTDQRPARSATEKWYPDHAVLSGATKDSLKNMPEFKYN